MARPTPFALVFGPLADERFPTVREAIQQRAADPRDRDAFLMEGEVVQLLRDLRPDDGLGEAMDQLVAFVHHAYLTWAAGNVTATLSPDDAEQLVAGTLVPVPGEAPARYIQLPERRFWGQPMPDAPHEPLDGCNVAEMPDGALRVLGVFGLHPDRLALTAVETTGARPADLKRADGSPLFAAALPGGSAAGLYSITGEEELLELGWRLH